MTNTSAMQTTRLHRNWGDLVSNNFRIAARTSRPLRQISVAATFGSCFANEIRNALSDIGIQTLPALTQKFANHVSRKSFEIPSWGCWDERIHLQYYNPGSLAQELMRAVGQFNEEDHEVWMTTDNQNGELWADPYKRSLYAESQAALLKARAILNEQIVHALHNSDTIVLTVGLTEAFLTEWRNFACLPPLISDRRAHKANTQIFLDYNKSFHLLECALKAFFHSFPDKQIIITTSPIPLDRTFRNVDIAVANCESKSILRAVCGALERQFQNVYYFPSYELVLNDASSWEKDRRHVTRSKVQQIVGDFIASNFSGSEATQGNSDPKFEVYSRQWMELQNRIAEKFETLSPDVCRQQLANTLEAISRDEINSRGRSPVSEQAYWFWCGGAVRETTEKSNDALVYIQNYFRQKKNEFLTTNTADAEIVIELGAGPGLNLFSLAVSDPNVHKFALHAFEYTRSGRELTNYLSGRLEISVHTHAFDFYKCDALAPMLQDIAGDRRTVIFTCYAIEQIPTLPRAFIEALLTVKNLQRVLHIEPVGWQAIDNPTDRDLAFQSECARMKYNTNLIKLLLACEKESLVADLDIARNALSHRFGLPGTFIKWAPAQKRVHA